MQRVAPVLASFRRVLACTAARAVPAPSSLSAAFRPDFYQRASFAKKSGAKGEAAADAAGGKAPASKTANKSGDGESVDADAAMQAIMAIMKCAPSYLLLPINSPYSSPSARAHRSELQAIKVGQADPRILDAVKVPAYGGAPLPFSGVAQAAARDGNVLIVSVFDQQLLPAVQKAISSASLGLNPILEGSFLRIPIPKVTADARAVISDRVAALGEGALQPAAAPFTCSPPCLMHSTYFKNRLRRARRDALDGIKLMKLPEDDEKKEREAVEKTLAQV
jgi:ribosome recycling factor